MSIDCGVKPYIKNLTNNEQLQEALNNKHNAIFKQLYDSKAFKLFKGVLYESPSTIRAGRVTIEKINAQYGALVTKIQNPVSGKPYVFVNVRNLVQSTWDEINPNKPKNISKQGTLDLYQIDLKQQEKANKKLDDKLLNSLSNIENTKAPDKELNTKIQNFLQKIGISIETVKNIRDKNGNVINANGVADLLNKIIQIVEGKERLDTLPEEAAHFFVEMLGENHLLYKEMVSKITSYKLYSDVVNAYKDIYRNKDGTIDFTRIKKEAIGQLITSHIIKSSLQNESNENISFLNKWWSKLWKFIADVFNKTNDNPFETSANKILNADVSDLNNEISGETYYQLGTNPVSKLDEDQSKITLDNSIDTKTGQKRHIYTYNGVMTKGSVTSIYVDSYLKKRYPTDNREQHQKKIDLLKAEYGDKIHEIIQDIIDTYVDPTTHLLRSEQVASKNKNVGTEHYEMFEDYIRGLISQFPAGTKFLREVKIFDSIKNIAGSIDFLVIEPDGLTSIYDWKSQEIHKGQDEIKSYKAETYRIQLSEYKKILEKFYGIKEFRYLRAIPIKVSYAYEGKGVDTELKHVTSIKIGNLNPSEIPENENYLLPITLKEEKSEDENLSSYISKLKGVLDILENKSYRPQDKLKRDHELKMYRDAIRDLQLKHDIRKYIQLGLLQIKNYNNKVSSGTLSLSEAREALDTLSVFTNTSVVFANYMNDLKKMIVEQPENGEQITKIISDYNSINSNAELVIHKVDEYIKETVNRVASEKINTSNVGDAETEIGKITGWFSALSTITQKSFRLFSKLLRESQHIRDSRFDGYASKLKELQPTYIKWAESKGFSGNNLFNPLLDIDEKTGKWTGKFLKKIKSEFYSEKTKAIQGEDLKWFEKNTIFNKEKYEKDKEEHWKFIQSIQYSMNQEENLKTQVDIMNKWIKNNDVNANPSSYFNPKNYYVVANESWNTDKWKDLFKKNGNEYVNKTAVDTYEYFQSLVSKGKDLGILDENSHTFIPNVLRSKLEQVVFGDKIFSEKGFLEKFEVDDDNNLYSPQINPITGKVDNNIPKHFLNDLGIKNEDGTLDYSSKSNDLFKVFGLWSNQLAIYESASEIEDISQLLLHVEKNKGHIETNAFGKAVFNEGEVKKSVGNERNAQLLEEFVNYYLYNKESGKTEDKKIKIGDKEYSLNKSMRGLLQFFSFKTLALNPISGTSNFVGGTGNAFFKAQKGIMFNTSDWTSSIKDLTTRDSKSIMLLHVSEFLLEDVKHSDINKLSVSKIINANTADKLFFLMRSSDKAVQYPVALALMKNHMVDEDGNIADIVKYVKSKNNYSDIYNLSSEERNTLKNKIEKEVVELKNTKSIHAISKIENDRLIVPGVDFSSKQWGDFKSKIKQVNKSILGNSTRDDINSIRIGILGSALMQFRGWMPQMIQERTGKFRFDDSLDTHTIGTFRLFMGELFSKRAPALLSGIISASGTNMIEAAKQRYIEEKSNAIEKGEDFNISESEFIDLYIGSIKSQYKEFLVLLSFAALLFTGFGHSPDDDEQQKGAKKYMTRALNRYTDEFAFYYIPTSFTQLVKSPLPVIGLAEDFLRFLKSSAMQSYGWTINDEVVMKKAKPAKYMFRILPIFKEGVNMRAIFDDDFRKDWGVRL